MPKRLIGGYSGQRPAWSASYAPGIWTPEQQLDRVKAGEWPREALNPFSDLLLTFNQSAGTTVPADWSTRQNVMPRVAGGAVSESQARQGTGSWFVNTSGASLKGNKLITVPGDFMWQCYWYPEVYQAGYKALFGLEGASSWQLFINDDGSRPPFFLKHRPGFNMILSPGGGIPLNQWNHVALTRESGTLTLWFNGTPRGSTTFTETMSGLPVANEWFTGTPYLGYIDLVQMVTGVPVFTSAFTPSGLPYQGP
jgi:hypothetical protein